VTSDPVDLMTIPKYMLQIVLGQTLGLLISGHWLAREKHITLINSALRNFSVAACSLDLARSV